MSGREDAICDDAYDGDSEDGIVSRSVRYLFHQVCVCFMCVVSVLNCVRRGNTCSAPCFAAGAAALRDSRSLLRPNTPLTCIGIEEVSIACAYSAR